jgi:predicted small lipoprotein YifL
MRRMRTLLTALMVFTLAGSAWAQGGKGGLPVGPNPDAKRNAEDAKERETNAKDYEETMRRLRAQPAPKADPWARMRPADK